MKVPRNFSVVPLCCIATLFFTFTSAPHAQDLPTSPTFAAIRNEAFQHSSAMDDVQVLSDVYGSRMTGSPSFREAVDWTMDRLRGYGLENVHREAIAPADIGGGLLWSPPGWSSRRCAVSLVEPQWKPLIAFPMLYSAGIAGRATGETIFAPFPHTESDLARFIAQFKGKLKSRILLQSDQPVAIPPQTAPDFHRYTDSELSDLASPPGPSIAPSRFEKGSPASAASMPPSAPKNPFAVQDRLFRFLKSEGALAYVMPARRAGGTAFVHPPLVPPGLVFPPPPGFQLAAEDYNRIVRLMKGGRTVKLEVEMETHFEDDKGNWNVFGEIPGGAKKDEFVLLGAHLDSWHLATGATDNAAGCAVMMEAMRILKSLHLRMDRTVRIALWGGEELGELGSRSYVAQHLLDPRTRLPKPDYQKISGYFNIDDGAGRVRGIYLQGNEKLEPIFRTWLAPFQDLDATTVTPRTTLGSDQRSFEDAGIPGLSFIQDPLDYEARTHHTNMDTLDYVPSDDLKQSAAIIAALAYQAANDEALLPRKTDATR